MIKYYAKAVYDQLDRALSRFGDHRLTDWAAALTYYSVLSIFPGLLALISLLGVIGHGTADALIDTVRDLPEGAARDIVLSAVTSIRSSSGAATTALIIGTLVALYSASSYVGAFMRAAAVILEVKETRRFFVTIPLRFALTLLLMLLAVATGVAIVLTGPIAEQFTRVTGFDGDVIGGWGVIKWPIVLFLFLACLSLLYTLGPNHEKRRFRLATPGTGLALALWLLASALFSVYVGSFAHYNKVYGSLAGVAIFLIWLYLSNVAILLGLEFDNELRRYRREHGFGAFSRQRRLRQGDENPRGRS